MNGFIISSFILCISQIPIQGEVRSGIWILDRARIDSTRSRVDFSELMPFCSVPVSASRCSVRVADCFFRYGSVIAPYGVCYDSAISEHLRSFVLHKTINYDREALFYLDSMVKQYGLKATQGEYHDSISINNSAAFFIKTSENRYAAMIQLKMLVGDAIDQIWYYWAYQPDSVTALLKNRIFEQPSALSIELDVFSGRSNPYFRLADSAAIAEITHAIYVSINTLLDSTVKRADTTTCNSSYLGYRKMSISNMFPPDDPLSSYMPIIDVCNGKMTYYKVSPMSTTPQRVSLYDKNCGLEKLIIRICCEKNLSVTDEYDTVKFCDLVPDSLKPAVSIASHIAKNTTGNLMVNYRVRSPEIRFQGLSPGPLRIECFSLSGERLASIRREVHEQDEFSIDLRDHYIGAGAYIIKLSRPGSNRGSILLPVFLNR